MALCPSIATLQIFNHIKKIGKLSGYPVQRAMSLIEALDRDFAEQIVKVLAPQQLLYLSFEEFEKVTGGYPDLFLTWEQRQGLM